MDAFFERTLGLAGIFQAARLVQQVAREGSADRIAARASLNSVLVLDAINTQAVFSDKEGIEMGLRSLQSCFSSQRSQLNLELFKYVDNLAQLQKRLLKDDERMAAFSQGVEALTQFSGDELTENMEKIYVTFVSNLQPKILVNGEQGYLADPQVASQVRSFLLAGIRASFLWQQKGGSRWDFQLKRKQYEAAARELLRN